MYNFFIHSSVDGHLGCVYILAIVNSAAENFGVHVLFLIMIFSMYMPNSEVAGSYVSFIPSFLWNFHAVLHCGYISLHVYQQCKEVSFLHILSSIYCLKIFDDGILSWYQVISYYSFHLNVYNNEQCCPSFHVLAIGMFSLLKCLFRFFCPFYHFFFM